MPRLLGSYPGVSIEFLTSSDNVNFSRWEADVAVRLRRPEKGDFSVTRLGAASLFLIQPAELLTKDEAVVCRYPDALDGTPESQLLTELGLKQKARCIASDPRIIAALIRSGAALGILPEYAARPFLSDPAYTVSVLPQKREIWLLIQNHLKGEEGTRIVVDWVRSCFVGKQWQ